MNRNKTILFFTALPFLFLSINLKAGKTDTLYIKDPANPARVTFREVTRDTRDIIEEGVLLNGQKEGVWRTYFDNNFIATTTEYHNGLRNGLSMAFAGDATILKEEMYKNDVKDGWTKVYSRNRKLKEESHYKNGLVDGTQKIYYPDGPLQEWGHFKAGVRDSVNTWYYSSGKITVQYFYANNNLSGPTKSFYEDGKLKSQGTFLNGKQDGLWKEYADTSLAKPEDKTSAAKPSEDKAKGNIVGGKLKEAPKEAQDTTSIIKDEGNYVNDQKQGIWKVYDENGKLIKTEEYKDGILVKEKKVSK